MEQELKSMLDGINRQQSDNFKKFDNDKPDFSLFEPGLMQAYCRIGTMGAKKYGRNNWKKAKLEDIHRYVAAFGRHYYGEDEDGKRGFMTGGELDSESGMPHLWHAIWNIAAIDYFVKKFGYKAINNILRGG